MLTKFPLDVIKIFIDTCKLIVKVFHDCMNITCVPVPDFIDAHSRMSDSRDEKFFISFTFFSTSFTKFGVSGRRIPWKHGILIFGLQVGKKLNGKSGIMKYKIKIKCTAKGLIVVLLIISPCRVTLKTSFHSVPF